MNASTPPDDLTEATAVPAAPPLSEEAAPAAFAAPAALAADPSPASAPPSDLSLLHPLAPALSAADPEDEFDRWRLLAEVDADLDAFAAWAQHVPHWPPLLREQAFARHVIDRAKAIRSRLDAPLLVATLGGTGTGKSSLVNAIVGQPVAETGRARPTTRRPTWVASPDWSPERMGLAREAFHVVALDLPILTDLVLIDCPDPDTSDGHEAGTNLATLRAVLPQCDALLVTATQQKYRSARVMDELASASPGACLVFVQTHADVDDDIRADWRLQLAGRYAVDEIFWVDVHQPHAGATSNPLATGEFARLLQFLGHELAQRSAARIRRLNLLDLVEHAQDAMLANLAAREPALAAVRARIEAERLRLAARLAVTMHDELAASRQPWEARLLAEVVERWGFSPFCTVLRLYQSLGWMISSTMLARVRGPGSLALWGAYEGARQLQRRRSEQLADTSAARAVAWGWDEAELRAAAHGVASAAAAADLPVEMTRFEPLERQATRAGSDFLVTASSQLQRLVSQLAERHSGPTIRNIFEALFLIGVGIVGLRWAYNFFYASWIAPWLGYPGQDLYGVDFFLHAALFLLIWSGALLGLFLRIVQGGLGGEIDRLVAAWKSPATAAGVFAEAEATLDAIADSTRELHALHDRIRELHQRLGAASPEVARRKIE